MNRQQIKERQYEAVVYNLNDDYVDGHEVYTRYYHNDIKALKKWVAREGYADSPDFGYFIRQNPFYVIEDAECNPADFPGMTADELKLYEVAE
jgi:hypothetical protein